MGEIAQLKGALPEPVRARDYSASQLALVQRTVAADCNADEFNLFVEVARRSGLDPFKRQIYAVVYSKDNAEKRKMSIITGIDGFRAIAQRNGNYRPDEDEPNVTIDPALVSPQNPQGIVKATVRCWKYGPDKVWYPATGVAHWAEFVPLKLHGEDGDMVWVESDKLWEDGPKKGKPKMMKVPKDGSTAVLEPSGNWKVMPHVMIAKCAEAQALRKGWPEDLSGIYTPEEMAHVEAAVDATEMIEKHKEDERLRLVGARDGVALWWRAGEPLELVSYGTVVDRVVAFLRDCQSATEVMNWFNTNKVSFQTFWAHHKADALELKKQVETRYAELGGVVGG